MPPSIPPGDPSATGLPGAGAFRLLPLLVALLPCCPTARPLHAADATVIATGDTPVVRQLQQWWQEGTAAGNVGDWYDNRDRGHSLLPLAEFPQLTQIQYNAAEVQLRQDWGAAQQIRPTKIVIGNSSTASHPVDGTGSNARLFFSTDSGFQILQRQYRANNWFVYPEHLDHDPGHNGSPGWGDLFHANTPYVQISQGSSSSDQPFLRAYAYTLAAFQPATKQKLASAGLLMPTLQMLLRLCATNVVTTNNYLSWRAHPTAFEGSAVDPLRMGQLAHRMTPDNLPPLAQLRVVSNDRAKVGVDYFDDATHERLTDTPGAVARLWRSTSRTRRMVVSAEDSFDPNNRPLTYRWVVTRGDPARLTIRPLNSTASVVEIVFEWAGRRPVAPDSDLDSNRLDVALFAHNGTWWSAPAFVTWFNCDRELRSYDRDGRLRDILYAAADTRVSLPLLTPIYDWLAQQPQSREAEAFRELAGDEAISRILASELTIRPAEEQLLLARTNLALANAELTRAQTAVNAGSTSPALADLKREASLAAAAQLLAAGEAATAETAARLAAEDMLQTVQSLITGWLWHPTLVADHPTLFESLRARATSAQLDRLNNFAFYVANYGLTPTADRWMLLPTDGRAEFDSVETNLVAQLNVTLLNDLLPIPGTKISYAINYSPVLLFRHKTWRDVYRYDRAGRLLGWRRFGDAPARDFTADGLLVLNRDALGRPRQAQARVYRRSVLNVVEEAGPQVYTYSYDGPDDLRGRPFENQ